MVTRSLCVFVCCVQGLRMMCTWFINDCCMIRGDAASGHKGHQSGSVAGLRYLGSTLLRDRAIIKCNNIVGCDTVQLQSVAGLLSGYERRRSASILFCQLCQIFTIVGFCQIFTQPQRSLNSSSTFSENRGTNGEWVESSNGNDVTKIVTKRLFSIEIGLVTAKEVTRNSYTALST